MEGLGLTTSNNDGWVARVTSLNQWKRGGERAPHKPLLLLYAIGQLQRTGTSSIAFVDAKSDLTRLLVEFGPPRRPSPGYPFHHLTNDNGLWIVHTNSGIGSPGSKLGDLLDSGAVGSLTPDFAAALTDDPHLVSSVVRAILDANFPETIHRDILDAVGIDPDRIDQVGSTKDMDFVRRRDPSFRPAVLLAYEYRCAICGYDGQVMREAVGIEAAHIRWWAADGPDDVGNSVALCSLHHKLFDRGVIGITNEHLVAVSQHFVGRSTIAEVLVLAFVGKPLLEPQRGHPGPDPHHVAWHSREVFRNPERMVPTA